MLTLSIIVNGVAVHTVTVRNCGTPAGRPPTDSVGDRLYRYIDCDNVKGTVVHARVDGACVLAAKVYANLVAQFAGDGADTGEQTPAELRSRSEHHEPWPT